MKIIQQSIVILGLCLLPASTGRGQDLVAAFKIANSPRPFLFNFHSPSSGLGSTNAAQRGVDGLQTVLAKRFEVARRPGGVAITLFDAVVCRAHRAKGEELGSAVMIFREWGIYYPAATSVLVPTGPMRLADLSEKTFDAPEPSETYTGEEAIKKLKEMGLEPPEDMDWEAATNHGSSQLDGAANGSQPIRSETNRTSGAAGSRR